MEADKDPGHPAARWNDAWRGVLFASAKVLRVAERDLIAREGFPLTWLDVLAQLYDAPGNGLRMQEAAGLVRREPVPGDRRGVRVVLTPEGRRRHDAAFAEHLRLIEREFGDRLTPDQHQAVADALTGFWHDGEESAPAE
jgi:hypothetical protein